MQILRNALGLFLVELLCWQTCLAQVNPWDRVKLIEDGKKVQVKLRSGKTVSGKMESWSTDGLSVRQGKDKVVPLAKADVAQVAMVAGMSRGERATYAGLITGGIGGGLMGAACASWGCEPSPALLVSAAAAFYGLIAAGIAALFPQHKEVIYTARTADAPAQLALIQRRGFCTMRDPYARHGILDCLHEAPGRAGQTSRGKEADCLPRGF